MSSVSVVAPVQSGRKVYLAVVLNGRPQKRVKVEFYRYEVGRGQEHKPRLSRATDDDGWVKVNNLAPGHYYIVASSDKNLHAYLYVDVFAHVGKTPSAFSMELQPSPYPTREQLLANAEKKTTLDRVTQFRGVVHDPSGAEIPRVLIEVVRKGTERKDRVARLKSGKTGRFSAQLSAGVYVAIFTASGFRTQLIPFELAKDGLEQLNVTLQIAPSSQ